MTTTITPPQVALAPARAGRTYIAGPMTGLPDFNYPAFNAAAAALRAKGVDAINPADHGGSPGATWEDYLRADLVQLATCEAIYFLPGWSKSRGALLEHHIATALGMRVEFAEGAETEAATCKGGVQVAAAPVGWMLVPERMTLDPDTVDMLVTNLQGDEDAEDVTDRWCGAVRWVGDTIGDHGQTYYGLNFANIECMEEGSLPLAEFAAPTVQALDGVGLERIRNELHAMSKQVPDDWVDPIIELQRDVQSLIDGDRAVGNG